MTGKFKWLLLPLLCSVMSLASCSAPEVVDYWKVNVLSNSNMWNTVIRDYITGRFDRMCPEPNSIQKEYLSVAILVASHYAYSQRNQEWEELTDKEIQNSIGYYFYEHSSPELEANVKSHPELWVKNIKKIIGDVADLKKELMRHVKVDEWEPCDVAGNYDSYNVLYNIDDQYYLICVITVKGNGISEFQVIDKSKSINDILYLWQEYGK